ncbi:MAG TPA: hypothetical protein VF951_01555 [Streptosporangiaceae bacterium]
MTGARSMAFSLVRGGYCAFLLCAPGAAVRLCGARPASPRARTVTRLLGVRHLIQAAVTAAAPNALVLAIGAQVDLAHAASMLALATADRPLRHAGLADGLTAAMFAAVGGADARTRRRQAGVRS